MDRLRSALLTSDQRMVWAVVPLLSKMGLEADTHSSAEKALESLRRTHCDLLILDFPLAGALSFLQQLRSLPRNRDAVVVAMAASFRAAEELRQAGADLTCERSLDAVALTDVLLRAKGQVTGDMRKCPRTSVGRLTYLCYSFDGVRHCQAVVVDISAGGVCIEALEGLQAGRTVSVSFSLPAMKTPVTAVGEIMWRDHSGRAGIRFTQIAESAVRQIERWLEAANRPFDSTMGLAPRRAAAAGAWSW